MPEAEPTQGDPDMEAIMVSLIGCVCAALEDVGRPVCCCMWARGETRPPADRCDCTCTHPDEHNTEGQGVAWVRTVSLDNIATPTEPRNTFGSSACAIPAARLRVTVEVGIYRCIDVGDAETGPDCKDRTQTAADGAWDDAIIRTAALCCEPLWGRRMTFLRQVPVGPSGGCGGSVTTWTLDLVEER